MCSGICTPGKRTTGSGKSGRIRAATVTIYHAARDRLGHHHVQRVVRDAILEWRHHGDDLAVYTDAAAAAWQLDPAPVDDEAVDTGLRLARQRGEPARGDGYAAQQQLGASLAAHDQDVETAAPAGDPSAEHRDAELALTHTHEDEWR